VVIAEDLGLIREMDLFIINKALLAVPKGVHLFVNISMSSFFAVEFRDEFRALLQSPQAQGRLITIEFTERQTTDMTTDFFKQLDELRASGCKIALDDFGAGYSTYSYLRKLKPDFVKIDGSFVQQILTNPEDYKIVEHIRELSTVFGAKSIAEHVEDAETADVLRRIGVDFAQGYYYGKPKMIQEYVPTAVAV
jgi:EAL domain-containing protein (putative c-di-GMP-specific phosphodiesterase class I)